MNSRVRLISKSPDKNEIAFIVLREEVVKQLKSIQDRIVSSLDGCEIEMEKRVDFAATLIKEALKAVMGEA